MKRALIVAIASLFVAAAGSSAGSAEAIPATYYGDGSDGYAGQLTSSGDICCGYTAATNLWTTGTVLTVCFDACVDVIVNDTCGGCVLDLGYPAALAIGLAPEVGTADVSVY